MMSFLVNVFFRRELYRCQAKLQAGIPADRSSLYASAGFSRICHELGADVFSLADITANGALERWVESSRALISACEKVHWLRWLLLPHDNRATCAAGGAAKTAKCPPEN